MSVEASVPARLGAAVLARQAMRLMAARKLAPTPENYRRAWLDVGGQDEAGPEAGRDLAEAAAAPAPDDDWAGRIGRLVAALDATVPGWTPARKREGLRQVLGSSPDAATLAGRMDRLLLGWSRPWGELTELVPAGGEDPARPSSPPTSVRGLPPSWGRSRPRSARARPG